MTVAPQLPLAHYPVPGDDTTDATGLSPSFRYSVPQLALLHLLQDPALRGLVGESSWSTDVDAEGNMVQLAGSDGYHAPPVEEGGSTCQASPACEADCGPCGTGAGTSRRRRGHAKKPESSDIPDEVYDWVLHHGTQYQGDDPVPASDDEYTTLPPDSSSPSTYVPSGSVPDPNPPTPTGTDPVDTSDQPQNGLEEITGDDDPLDFDYSPNPFDQDLSDFQYPYHPERTDTSGDDAHVIKVPTGLNPDLSDYENDPNGPERVNPVDLYHRANYEQHLEEVLQDGNDEPSGPPDDGDDTPGGVPGSVYIPLVTVTTTDETVSLVDELLALLAEFWGTTVEAVLDILAALGLFVPGVDVVDVGPIVRAIPKSGDWSDGEQSAW